jgi:superfamily II DNA/RNA helicase
MTTTTTPITNFADLGLSAHILKAIDDMGYTTPTPIQAEAIPHALAKRDVVGLAQTGTGKTASFTLPMIELLSNGRAKMRMPRSLVLTPTRELAAQVAENFDKYGIYSKLTKALLVGGESMNEQIRVLEKGVDVLIATPGRLLDLFERGQILMTDIRILVIDEADRMLDMGFIPDIEKIISRIPSQRQTLLFSATMPPEIRKLTERFLKSPIEISVAPPATTATTIDQKIMMVTPENKKRAIKSILDQEPVKNAFVFCNRKRDVDLLGRWLKDQGFKAAPLHGDMVQSKRTETLNGFKSGEVILLVCSDVAARGLDVSGVSHVFNFDVPFNPDDYVHRIGRTGRAGQTGVSWTLATDDDEKLVKAIEARIGRDIPTVPYVTTKSAASSNKHNNEAPKAKSAPKELSKPQPKQPSKPQKKAQKPLSDDVIGFGDDIPAFLRRH